MQDDRARKAPQRLRLPSHPEPQTPLRRERSRGTDDEEFYIPRVLHIRSEQDLPDEALGYVHYYNNRRTHSSSGYETPWKYLKRHAPHIDESIRTPPPITLDNVAVDLGLWNGYSLLAHHHGGTHPPGRAQDTRLLTPFCGAGIVHSPIPSEWNALPCPDEPGVYVQPGSRLMACPGCCMGSTTRPVSRQNLPPLIQWMKAVSLDRAHTGISAT